MTNDSLVSFTGASWTNLGALTEFSREGKLETQQPPSQNCEHKQVISKMAETVNVTIQELNMTNYNMLMGSVGYSTATVGSATTANDTYSTGSVSTAVNEFLAFKNQSWSSTSATIPIATTGIMVSGSSTMVLGTAYFLTQEQDGTWGITINTTGSTWNSAVALSVKYSYIPKASNILAFGGADNLTPFMMKVYSLYADGRTITSYYPRVEFQSGGAIADKDGASGAWKDMKFGLEAREHDSYTWNSQKKYRIDVQTTA